MPAALQARKRGAPAAKPLPKAQPIDRQQAAEGAPAKRFIVTVESDDAEKPRRLLVTVEEMAYMLSLGRAKAYELISHGEIKSILVGAARRVPVSAILAYIERLAA